MPEISTFLYNGMLRMTNLAVLNEVVIKFAYAVERK
jgi:hypothetical protein